MNDSKNGIGLGDNTNVTGENSISIGAGATLSGGRVALGAGSVASRADTISVGKSGTERQMTNVAAGTVGTDAVNLDQLNSAKADAINTSHTHTDSRITDTKTEFNQHIDNFKKPAINIRHLQG